MSQTQDRRGVRRSQRATPVVSYEDPKDDLDKLDRPIGRCMADMMSDVARDRIELRPATMNYIDEVERLKSNLVD